MLKLKSFVIILEKKKTRRIIDFQTLLIDTLGADELLELLDKASVYSIHSHGVENHQETNLDIMTLGTFRCDSDGCLVLF